MKWTIIFSLLFLGWLAHSTYSFVDILGEQQPFSVIVDERPSPNNWIDEEQIKVLNNHVIISQEQVTLARYANTNSMDPFIDEDANGLEIKPVKEKLQEGDIISYESETFNTIIVHRIIEIGEDEKGIYYIVKGDNNNTQDPEKVRFEQIKGVLIGVIY